MSKRDFTEDEMRHLSSEYRKTAHAGEFEFRKSSPEDHSLSHEEVVERLEKMGNEMIKKIKEFEKIIKRSI